MKKVVLLAPIIVILLALSAGRAHACICDGEPQTPNQALQSSDAVFLGRVLGSDDGIGDRVLGGGYGGFRTRLEVKESWKGVSRKSILIRTHAEHGGGCSGPYLETGQTYLVYARRDDNLLNKPLTMVWCGRTSHITNAGEDLQALGPGTIRIRDTDRDPVPLAVAGIGLALAAMLLQRRRAGRRQLLPQG